MKRVRQTVAGVLFYAIPKHGEKASLALEVKEIQKMILSAETYQHQCYLIISMALELFWTVQMRSHQFQCQQNNRAYFPFTCTGISETPSIIVKVQQIKLDFFSSYVLRRSWFSWIRVS